MLGARPWAPTPKWALSRARPREGLPRAGRTGNLRRMATFGKAWKGIVGLGATVLPLPASEPPAPGPAAPIALRLEGDLFALIGEARAAGASEGEILEHRILRALQLDDRDALVTMARDLAKTEVPFGEGRLFSNAAARDGFVAAVQALFFDEAGDLAAFREAVATARVNSPQWMRLLGVDDLAAEVDRRQGGGQVSLEIALATADGGGTTLAALLEGRKGLLLDFWASWCGPCIRAMPDLKEHADAWRPQGLEVAGVNTDQQDQPEHAARIRERFAIDFPWLLEPPTDPLAGPLEIDSIPRMVLLDPTGRVVFNGHPADRELRTALAKLGITP